MGEEKKKREETRWRGKKWEEKAKAKRNKENGQKSKRIREVKGVK